MSEKYLNIDLNDPRSAAIAEVMGNKTAKKILDLIAEKEVSESDISSALNIPLNTVGYNIDKLLRAELIEKSKNYFWSSKGKKIPTYRLSNKKILISPRRLTSAPTLIIASIIGVLLLIVLFNINNNNISLSNNESVKINDNLKHFSSYSELEKFLNESASSRNSNNYYSKSSDMALASSSSDAPVAMAESKSGGGFADSYSTTNIQTLGVDEPDFVKNDGKYIYMISGKNLYVVEAYPAETMKIISNISLDDYASNLFINEDKVIVLFNSYQTYGISGEEGLKYGDLGTPEAISSSKVAANYIAPTMLCYGCGGYSKTKTNVIVYDVSSKENPKVVGNYSFSGNYVNARMIGNYVYVISQDYSNGYYNVRPMYDVNGISREVAIEDISYSSEYGEDFIFTTIGAISLDDFVVETKVYLLGSTSNVYVSENNIYLTMQKWMDYNEQSRLMMEAKISVMPSKYQTQIEEILSENTTYNYEKESKVNNLIYEYSEKLAKEEQSDFNKKLQSAIDEAEIKMSKEYEKTIIHKINVDKMDITYIASGEISGYLLNQFSLDEYEGNLRVAVTTGNWRITSLNHLYILDENLNVIGKLQDLASGERIYSTRFIGTKLYMVTFKQVDPLFVIDLSNPQSPSVLGYLKITGYSSYLQAYDENNIIGIGMEADSQGQTSGVKIALFDVSDVNNPIEKAKYEIKSEGKWSYSYSDALYDHKAFLFDKEKNLLVVPIQYSYYENDKYISWNGAYAFYIDSESIELDAKITHIEDYVPKYSAARDAPKGEERSDGNGNTWVKIKDDLWQSDKYDEKSSEDSGRYYTLVYDPSRYNQTNEYIDNLFGGVNYSPYDYSWNKRIQRSLYMDDVLYTVSLGMIKANSLSSFEELNSLEINYTEMYSPAILY